MIDRKPLVLNDAAEIQQLQATDELDIPLEQKHQLLEEKFSLLVQVLIGHGIQLPEELLS